MQVLSRQQQQALTFAQPFILHLSLFTWFTISISVFSLVCVTVFAVVSHDEAQEAMLAEFHAALREETIALETVYQLQGKEALTGVITARANANQSNAAKRPIAVYLLTDAAGKKVAGNLAAWPSAAQVQDESSIEFVDTATGDNVIAVIFLLYGEQRLLVGRRAAFEHVGSHLWRNYLFLVFAVVLASIFGGWFFTRRLREKLTLISQTAERIRHGHLHERIPQTESQDEIEALIRQLNEMLDQVAKLMLHARTTSSAIAHDLRHPISRLRNGLEVLAAQIADPALSERIESLTTDIDSILRIFQATLRLGRLEAGAYPLQVKEIDLAGLVSDAIALYEPMAESQERHIHFEGETAILSVDRDLLFQAVANLLDNALKHGDGAIDVTLKQGIIEVRDFGAGIPTEEVQRVMQPFVRLDESRTESGSGLGLSLVRAIAEAHGGSLRLEGAAPGLRAQICLPGSNTAIAYR